MTNSNLQKWLEQASYEAYIWGCRDVKFYVSQRSEENKPIKIDRIDNYEQ